MENITESQIMDEKSIRILAERAYPELRPTELCSKHGGPGFTNYPVECHVCFPDLWALINQHIQVRNKLLFEARIKVLDEAIRITKTAKPKIKQLYTAAQRETEDETREDIIAALETAKTQIEKPVS